MCATGFDWKIKEIIMSLVGHLTSGQQVEAFNSLLSLNLNEEFTKNIEAMLNQQLVIAHLEQHFAKPAKAASKSLFEKFPNHKVTQAELEETFPGLKKKAATKPAEPVKRGRGRPRKIITI